MKTKIILINAIRFILLILAQVFIFNKINLGGWLNPMIYPLFILLLPFETPKNLLLILAFILGLSVDLFTGSIGLNAGATVFMAFLRPLSLRTIRTRRDYKAGIMPGINDLGYSWFISYTLVLLFAHQLFYFTFETFSFSEIGFTLIRIVINTLFSSLIILFIDILFKNQAKKQR